MEIWSKIESYPNYEVSSYGRIRSLDFYEEFTDKNGRYTKRFRRGRILKPQKHSGGYMIVQLGKKNQKFIHRLVAQAFVTNLNNKPFVNHMDSDKTNNNACNLGWVDMQENQLHAVVQGKKSSGLKHPSCFVTAEQVQLIKDEYATGQWSMAKLANHLKLTTFIIHKAVNGKYD